MKTNIGGSLVAKITDNIEAAIDGDAINYVGCLNAVTEDPDPIQQSANRYVAMNLLIDALTDEARKHRRSIQVGKFLKAKLDKAIKAGFDVGGE